jgi:EmrB/QacA subfamily drug resistance transporter
MQSSKWSVMATVAGGTFLATVDASIVNVAMPAMLRGLHTTLEHLEWVITAYLVTVTGLVLTAGRVGDSFGRKRTYLFGVAVFAAASAACAAAPHALALIAARVLQGVGAAAVIANGPALVTSVFAPQERGKALGIVGTAVAAGLMTGSPLGGVLVGFFDWPAVFWVNVPLGVAVFAWAVLALPPDDPPRKAARFDFQGALLLMATLTAVLLTATFGRMYGWAELETLGLGFAGLVGVLWLIRVEQETRDPVIDFTLLRNARFAGAAIAGMLSFVMVFGTTLLLPFYFTYVRGYGADVAGGFLMLQPAVMLVLSPISGSLSDRFGTRGLCVAGLGLISAALLLIAEVGPATPAWDLALRMGLLGLGVAIFQAPNNSALMGSVPPQRLGTAGGLLAMTRNAGMVFGISLAGTLFDGRFRADAGHGLQEFAAADAADFAGAMRLAFQVAAALGAPAILASLLQHPRQAGEKPTFF